MVFACRFAVSFRIWKLYVVYAVAFQRAVALVRPGVFILDSFDRRRVDRSYDSQVKVDQVAVIPAIPLGSIDAVGVVASGARRLHFDNVLLMQGKTLIAKDTVSIVATVAQCVCISALHGKIPGFIICGEQWFEDRSMRPVGAIPAKGTRVVAVMAIDASNQAALSERWDQADHIRVAASTDHWMVRGVTGLKFETDVGL